MMWSTNTGIGFFGGWSRLPLPPGRKGRALALLIFVGIVVLFLALAYFFEIAGVAAFAIGALVLTWGPVNRLGKETRARDSALRQELRDAAAESDSDFRPLGDGKDEYSRQLRYDELTRQTSFRHGLRRA